MKNLLVFLSLFPISISISQTQWKEIPLPPTHHQFKFIDFADSLDGVLFSDDGAYVMTTDGGAAWKLDSVSATVIQIKYFGKSKCWVVTDSLTLRYTENGKDWVWRTIPDTFLYPKVIGFASPSKIFLFHSFGIIYSEDGALTWKNNLTWTNWWVPISIDFADSSTGIAGYWLSGPDEDYSLNLSTTNSGTTWDTIGIGKADRISFFNSRSGYIIWSSSAWEFLWSEGGIALTNDGGKTFESTEYWKTNGVTVGYPISGIKYSDGTTFILFTDSGIKQVSGNSYVVTRNDTSALKITTFESVPDNNNWILASYNRFFQSLGIPTEVNHASNLSIPKQFMLSQNYPNPFNPATTIEYELVTEGFVTLVVYDILGRKVAVLTNEKKSPGSYRVSFDASALPTGVYLYRLQAGSFVETRKMIVAK